ncbi:helix-turn-helix domain-containing protein [Halochromatium salexigens]|uniref:Helix-turn-helix domain-containing protein n=1 Tax=Halochromatium salexigens TaxID=49447 RepID=A0AAJ0UF14_HALSE|nr:helix-turn-helix domain-containing protein [Halochromatium salexigens]MBK5930259.1 hypothetical protein [Halochromatium salexigens]
MSQTATVPQFATSPVDILRWQRALCAEPELTHAARSVATSLSHFINSKSGFAWPSLRTLAKRSKSSLSSVKRALKQLASLGLLQIEPGGCRRTNRYRAVLRRVGAQSVQAGQAGQVDQAVQGAQPAAR